MHRPETYTNRPARTGTSVSSKVLTIWPVSKFQMWHWPVGMSDGSCCIYPLGKRLATNLWSSDGSRGIPEYSVVRIQGSWGWKSMPFTRSLRAKRLLCWSCKTQWLAVTALGQEQTGGVLIEIGEGHEAERDENRRGEERAYFDVKPHCEGIDDTTGCLSCGLGMLNDDVSKVGVRKGMLKLSCYFEIEALVSSCWTKGCCLRRRPIRCELGAITCNRRWQIVDKWPCHKWAKYCKSHAHHNACVSFFGRRSLCCVRYKSYRKRNISIKIILCRRKLTYAIWDVS